MTTAQLHVDASDFDYLSRAISRLPEEIRAKAMSRAVRRVVDTARNRIVQKSFKRTDAYKHVVAERTKAFTSDGGNAAEIVMKSEWLSLYKLGAKQIKSGVAVRLRGSYRHAFIAQMKSGHRGVMLREGPPSTDSLPIRELFGPNPAHDINRHPDVFLEVLTAVIEQEMLPRYLHDLGQLLPKGR